MFFKGIKLKSFRCYSEALLVFSPKVNVFLGENGQGKTNILEALHILSTGDTFRFAQNQDLIRLGDAQAKLFTKIIEGQLEFDVAVELSPAKRIATINNKKVSTADLKRQFSTVVFSPESLSAIKDGPEVRRQLVDELILSFDKNSAKLISDYKKILRQRNKTLKDQLEGKITLSTLKSILDSLDPIYLELASRLTSTRLNAIKSILDDLNHAMKAISKNNVEISVEYVISGENCFNKASDEISLLFKKRSIELAAAEIAAGTTLFGPHKHDIAFLYGQKDSRIYCSQGQQRAIILSFKMAQIVYHRRVHGIYPVLMLDDVLSELDQAKRDSLILFLNEIKTQIFITTTDFSLPNSFPAEDISVIRIQEGKIFS